jgi:hypothetical protein
MKAWITRWSAGVLGLWLIATGPAFALTASAGVPALVTAAAGASLLALPLTTGGGPGDEAALDNQGDVDTNPSPLSGGQDVLLDLPTGGPHRACAVPARRLASVWFLVEPRFLRYARLLN